MIKQLLQYAKYSYTSLSYSPMPIRMILHMALTMVCFGLISLLSVALILFSTCCFNFSRKASSIIKLDLSQGYPFLSAIEPELRGPFGNSVESQLKSADLACRGESVRKADVIMAYSFMFDGSFNSPPYHL